MHFVRSMTWEDESRTIVRDAVHRAEVSYAIEVRGSAARREYVADVYRITDQRQVQALADEARIAKRAIHVIISIALDPRGAMIPLGVVTHDDAGQPCLLPVPLASLEVCADIIQAHHEHFKGVSITPLQRLSISLTRSTYNVLCRS